MSNRLLLDTHVFLWLLTEPERLGDGMVTVQAADVELLVSAASSWEIAVKYGLGKIPLPEPPARYVPSRLRAIGAVPVAIEHSHALAVADLPPLHRDPFDRLLVAQALALGLRIVTHDPQVARYPVDAVLVG